MVHFFAPSQPSPTPATVSTSVSTPTSPSSPNTGGKSNRRIKNWVTILAVIVMLSLIGLVVFFQGHVSGTEFAPSHFQERSFSFYELPIVHLQITPIHRKGITNSTRRYLRQKGLIPAPPKGPPENWHIVSLSRGFGTETDADARLLMDQFSLNQSSGKDYWHQWSIDHPKLAAELWPLIQRLASRELYILMPQLFQLVRSKRDWTPQTFAEHLDDELRMQYVGLINDMRDANRGQLANQLLTEAKQDYPGDQQIQSMKSVDEVKN